MSDFRKGTCADCKAEFKIPADFPHDRAKCRQCGGVVNIAAAGAAAPEAPKPVPAAKPPAPKPRPKPVAKAKAKPIQKPKPVVKPKAAPAPKPEPAPEPEEKPLTMKEKIMARKAAEAEAAKTPSAPAPKQAAPVKKAAPARKAKAAAAEEEEQPRAKRGAGASKRRPAAKGARGAKRGKRGEEAAEESGGRGRRARPEKKGAPMGGLIAIAVLVIGGGTGWYFMAGPGAKKEEVALVDPDAKADDAAADEMVADLPEEPETTPEVEETEAAEKPKEDPKPKVKKPKVYKPMDVVYDEIPVFGPAVGTSDEEWTELQALAVTSADMGAGARQGRATNSLKQAGYKAVPAILNQLRNVDLGSEEGYRLGDSIQRTLEKLHNGVNVSWDSERDAEGTPTPRAHMVNRKSTLLWLKTWNSIAADPTKWIATVKLGTDKYHDQLVAYSAVLHAAGITEGEYFDYVLDEDGASQAQDDEDLDDF